MSRARGRRIFWHKRAKILHGTRKRVGFSVGINTPKGKRKEAMEKLIADISAVLTDEQRPLYKELQQEDSEERRSRKNND